jgi:hypothetical protein
MAFSSAEKAKNVGLDGAIEGQDEMVLTVER